MGRSDAETVYRIHWAVRLPVKRDFGLFTRIDPLFRSRSTQLMSAAAPFPLVRRLCAGLVALAATLGPATGQVQTLAPEIVSAARLPQPPEQTAESVRVLDRAQLTATPAVTVD